MKKILLLLILSVSIVSCGKKSREVSPEIKAQVQKEQKQKDSLLAAMSPEQRARYDVEHYYTGGFSSFDGLDSATLILNLERKDGKLKNVKDYLRTSIDFVSYAFDKDKSLNVIITAGFVKLLDIESADKEMGMRHVWTRDLYEKVKDDLKVKPVVKVFGTAVKSPMIHSYYSRNSEVVRFLISDVSFLEL